MPKRIVNGHLLYTPVVTVVPGKLVFVSGILARNSRGEIVGKGDMAAQIKQVFENIRTALAAAAPPCPTSSSAKPSRRKSTPASPTSTPAWSTAAITIDRHDGRGPQAFASRLPDRSRGDGSDTGAVENLMRPAGGNDEMTPSSQPRRQTTRHSGGAGPFTRNQQENWSGTSMPSANSLAPCLRDVSDHAVARQRAGVRLVFGDTVDDVAPVLATFLRGWTLLRTLLIPRSTM